jgi:hypothetical protein
MVFLRLKALCSEFRNRSLCDLNSHLASGLAGWLGACQSRALCQQVLLVCVGRSLSLVSVASCTLCSTMYDLNLRLTVSMREVGQLCYFGGNRVLLCILRFWQPRVTDNFFPQVAQPTHLLHIPTS